MNSANIIRKLFSTVLFLLATGCAEHQIDTFQEWCEQITGVDLQEKHTPFWAITVAISYNGDAIRDDYTDFLNKTHLEKVQNRMSRMAWREGTNLHLVNVSSLLVIEPEEIIEGWRKGIGLAKEFKHTDQADICLYGTLTSMFDSLYIHSMKADALGVDWTDTVTTISTDREKRLGDKRL